jgi:hypothetical protein
LCKVNIKSSRIPWQSLTNRNASEFQWSCSRSWRNIHHRNSLMFSPVMKFSFSG